MTSNKINPNDVEKLVHDQLELMAQQLAMMGQAVSSGVAPVVASPSVSRTKSTAEKPQLKPSSESPQPAGRRALQKKRASGLTEQQQDAIQQLTNRYCEKTKETKRLTDELRKRLADNRSVAGFNAMWKEMVYQIVCEKSLGSKIWDVDGNEYVDITLCFGANLLGHSPDFVVKAVEEQLHKGYEVGMQNNLVGDVCELMCELTGNERITFSHSGCEAVLYATRIARTVTGRDKVVMFVNDIHGRGDLVLGRTIKTRNGLNTVPAAAGVPKHVVGDALVLQYGSDEALEVIREHAHEIAAVLVEPVRTRNPDLQPTEFLHEIRRITEESGSLLIFDEVVMGFRVHQGGAQAHFGIRADLVTYGKTLGGGMPIGAVAGKAEYIDVIDGGPWQYGDDSVPEAGMTVAGGTMIKHPISMAASRAFLTHLKDEGPELQEKLNARTTAFVKTLNGFYAKEDIPIHVENFASYFLPKFKCDPRFEGLFFCHLRDKGVHGYLDYPCFLSTAHTDSDVEFLIEAFKSTAVEMKAAGFMDD